MRSLFRAHRTPFTTRPLVFLVDPNPKGASDAPALRYCAVCPVRAECLDEQLRREAGGAGRRACRLPTGILGGTPPTMRRGRRIKELSIEQRKEVLLARLVRDVLPRVIEETETLAS